MMFIGIGVLYLNKAVGESLMRTKRRYSIKILAAVILAALIAGMLTGCGSSARTGAGVYSSLEDFKGSTLGTISGGNYDMNVEEVIEDVTFKTYPDLTGEISALSKGDIDGIVQDLSVATYLVAQHPEFTVFPETVAPNSFGYALQKDSPYTDKFTEVIQELYSDGTIEAMREKWFSGDEDLMVIDWDEYDTSDRGNGTLICAYDYTEVPLSYQGEDEEACGYEPELLLIIADRLGLGIEFEGTNFGSLISYIETGAADVACGGISITEERAEAVDFPESHYVGGVMIVCREDDVGAVSTSGKNKIYTKKGDFEGTTLGMLDGAAYEQLIDEEIEDVSFLTYNDLSEMISAITRGDVDGLVEEAAVADYMVANHPEFGVFPENIVDLEYGYGLAKDSPYTKDFSKVIQDLYDDGTIESLQEKWFSGDDDLMVIDWSEYDTKERANGTLRYACADDLIPLGYEDADGRPAGYEVELLLNIADRFDMGVDCKFADADELIDLVESGDADVISDCITITPERQEVMDFPESHYQGGITIICRSENLENGGAGESAGEESFGERLRENFRRTFVRDERWKTIGSGLLVTLEITLLAALFGTILGYGMCQLLRAKNRVVSTIASLFCRLIDAIPAVVLLLVVYFLIFASSPVGAIAVAVIVFTILFMVPVGGLLKTAIETVEPGQWDKACAMGLGRVRSFMRVVVPQALPSYRKEFITLLKSTSIVGYIAIQDLTKAADAIRARTYEAFFPLITTTVIYVLIAVLINVIVNRILNRFARLDEKTES